MFRSNNRQIQSSTKSKYFVSTFDAAVDVNKVIEQIALPFLQQLERGDFETFCEHRGSVAKVVGSLWQIKGIGPLNKACINKTGDHVGNAIIAGITGCCSRRANRYGVELLSDAHQLMPMEVRDEKKSTQIIVQPDLIDPTQFNQRI